MNKVKLIKRLIRKVRTQTKKIKLAERERDQWIKDHAQLMKDYAKVKYSKS